MSTPSTLPARAWLIVGLLWVVGCLNYLDRVMITTMRGSLLEAIPMSDAQFGILTSVFLWVYGLLSPFAGFLADRYNRSRVILISLFAWSAITWMTAHATTFNELLLTRALMGISEACYIPAALALIVDYHRDRTRSLAVGLHLSGVLAGSALGGLGGWLAERHTWAYAFEVFGFVGVAYSLVLVALLRDAPRNRLVDPRLVTTPENVRVGAALANLFSRPMFILALCYWGLLGVAAWGVVGWMPTYLNEHFHLTQGTAGLSATGYLQSAGMLGMLIGGAWADRWSRTNERARIFVPVIGLIVASPGILLAAHTGWLPLALAGLVIYGLSRSFSDANMMPILCLVSDPRYRATGYGVLNMFACVVGGVTIYVGGALRDAKVDVNNIFYFAAAALIVCAALLFFVKPSPAASN
jgi:MFS family permease